LEMAPAIDAIIETSSNSAGASGGSSDGNRLANIDLPAPGGPITRWHYHDKSGGKGLMMHIFFVPGNDLAHAYATEMG